MIKTKQTINGFTLMVDVTGRPLSQLELLKCNGFEMHDNKVYAIMVEVAG